VVEARGRKAYLKSYAVEPSGESTRDQVCQTDLSAIPVEAFVNVAGRVASFFDWSKRASILRHTFPKRKSLSIYADRVDDASGHIRTEVTTQHFSPHSRDTDINHTFKFTPLCV
jgi:hypothetical protein